MHNSDEQAIRERIEQTRTRMGETIEEIGDRVNPDRVRAEVKARARERLDEMKTNVKQKARNKMRDVEHDVSEAGRGVWATIRENPVPAGMVGIGLAWLVAKRSDNSRDYSHPSGVYRGYRAGYAMPYQPGRDIGYAEGSATGTGAGGYPENRYTADDFGERGASGHSHGVRERAAEAVDSVRDRAGHAAEAFRDRAEGAVDTAREKVSHASDRAHEKVENARYYAARAERRAEFAVQENPVAAGAMAMALGMAAGLMVPETRREHEMMGRTRDRMLERASEAARQAKERVREQASEKLGDSAKDLIDSALHADGSASSSGFTEPRR